MHARTAASPAKPPGIMLAKFGIALAMACARLQAGYQSCCNGPRKHLHP